MAKVRFHFLVAAAAENRRILVFASPSRPNLFATYVSVVPTQYYHHRHHRLCPDQITTILGQRSRPFFLSFCPSSLPSFFLFRGSDTPLAKMVQSPQLVRDMDWVDWCWPDDRKKDGQFPKVINAYTSLSLSVLPAAFCTGTVYRARKISRPQMRHGGHRVRLSDQVGCYARHILMICTIHKAAAVFSRTTQALAAP